MGASRVWAGYHATVILDASADKVYAWGLNNYGQLGITGEKRKTALFSPTEASAFNALGCGWTAVACGQHHSLALDDKGQLYAVGRCEYGRLGLGERTGDAEALEPVPALANSRVVSIAAGTSNSFAVTDTGEVFAWGMGSEGQLGTGSCSDAPSPAPAHPAALAGKRARAVRAGGQHTVLLVEDPNAAQAASPAPDAETSDQHTGDEPSEPREPEPVPAKKARGRATKRGLKQDQEEEVSSTSSAAPAPPAHPAPPVAPQKVNGDEKKETPMEVDETDSKQENKEETQEESKQATDTDITETKPDTSDTSSQDNATVPSETPDVEMKPEQPEPEQAEEKKAEVNGTPEEKKEVEIEAKTVESVQDTAAAGTTA
ncbi:regulator of chromosome condensation (RCC1) repeat domain-containing protein [Phthorimaea operculella]|nr:regulator of chromosome condensation (RCC1) repeat domain-containing protein [Phthorimaea operculella]